MLAETTTRLPATPSAPERGEQDQAAAETGSGQPGPGPRPRVEVVDALRGVAALVVLLQHGAELLWQSYGRWSVEVFRPGEWGVFVFFLVSGFVIPLSIERDRNPVSFWIGRAFRLFPLYWAALAAALVLVALDVYPVAAEVSAQPVKEVLFNLTMVQNFLGSPNIIGAAWSLAYEMVFYLFITVMLTTGTRGGAVKATVLTLLASITIGLLVAPRYLTNRADSQNLLVVLGLVAAGLVLVLPRIESLQARIIGGAAVLATVVLTVNQPLDLWFSLLLFATIGCGWVYHEAHLGRVPAWVPVALSAGTVLLAAYHLRRWVQPHEGLWGATVTWRPDTLTLAAAHLAFGLVYLARYRRFPWVLRWLGQISYSVYLVHALVIHTFHPFSGRPVLTFACWVGVTLAISSVTYRLVEVPAQNAGRHLRRLYRARQPDPAPA